MIRRTKSQFRRRGYSFIEMLFAIMTMSFGLMGVAASLYVGVDQTRSTVDETVAANLARQAAATLAQVMTRENTADRGDAFVPFREGGLIGPMNLEALAAGSQISPADPRYAWVPLYRRRADSPVAEVLIVAVRAEARPQFNADDVQSFDPFDQFPPTLQPAVASVRITNDEIEIDGGSASERVSPGTLIVLNSADGRLNGRVVRIAGRATSGRWQLAFDQNLSDLAAAHAQAARHDPLLDPTFTAEGNTCYVIGRGYADPKQPRKGFAGAAQPVAVYSTIVMLR